MPVDREALLRFAWPDRDTGAPNHGATEAELLSRALAETGRFDEAFAVADRMVKIGEADNGAYALVMIYNVRGSISLLHGDVQESLPILSRSIAVRQATNLPDFPMNASISLARGLLLLGLRDRERIRHERDTDDPSAHGPEGRGTDEP